MPKFQKLAKLLFVTCLASATMALPQTASASSYKVLEKFKGGQGRFPSGPLIADAAGNLYGVTSAGGTKGHCKIENGCGVVYRIAADGTYSVLYSFQGGTDGYAPEGNLLLDADGNLYGTSFSGGSVDEGTVFKLAPDGTKTILHSFAGSPDDGSLPMAGLIAGKAGNLYGTTSGGGANGFTSGTVFKLAPDGTETVLYSFCALENCTDGQNPKARLLMDSNGNLYGTTEHGGAFDEGTVFELAANGTLTVLHSFEGSPGDGQLPLAGLIADKAGNLYGTTENGVGSGTVFKVAPDGTETILHVFTGGSDGSFPESDLIFDQETNLLGTSPGGSGAGTIFRLATDGTGFAVLHSFAGHSASGSNPYSGVILANGDLFGTTLYGGRSCKKNNLGCGVVYRFEP